MNHKKTTISLVGFGIMILAFAIALIWPLLGQIKKESEDIVLQKKELALLEAKTQNLKKFQTRYKTYQPAITKINQLFISPTELISFIEFLEEEAVKFHLLIDITSLAPREKKTAALPSLDFQLNLVGSFPDFLKFLTKLENGSYLVEVANLSIRRLAKEVPQQAGQEGNVNVSFLIKVYTKEE